jgi:hypothetical protein
MKNRIYHRLYALVHGYFWLPCPICGKKFGGHELGGHWYQGGGCGVVTCSDCAERAEAWSIEVSKTEVDRGVALP